MLRCGIKTFKPHFISSRTTRALSCGNRQNFNLVMIQHQMSLSLNDRDWCVVSWMIGGQGRNDLTDVFVGELVR